MMVDAATTNWEEYAILAKEQADRGQLDEAIASYEKAIELGCDKPWVYIKLGEICSEQGSHQLALATVEKAIELNSHQSIWGYVAAAKLLQREGKFEEAIEKCEAGLRVSPRDQNLESLKVEIEEASSQEFDHWLKYATLARDKAEAGKSEEAIQLYERAISLSPDEAWPYIKLTDLVVRKKHLNLYEQAVQVEPENPWGYVGLVQFLKEEDRLVEALSKCEEGLSLNSDSKALSQLRLEIQRSRRELSIDKWLGTQNCTNLAFLAVKEGEKRELKDWLEYAVAAEENLNRERRKEAISLYEQSIRANPDQAWPYLKLSDLYKTDGKIAEAMELCRQAVMIEPQNQWAYISLADALKEDGQVEKAVIFYFRALLADPKEVWKKICQNLLQIAKYARISRFIRDNRKYLHEEKINSVVGMFELRSGNVVRGWAFDWENLKENAKVIVSIDNKDIIEIVCNDFNKDLKRIGLGKGNYGFEFIIPDEYLSGQNHKVMLKTAEQGMTIAEEDFKFEIRGNIDKVDSSQMAGWVVAVNSPQDSLDLDIYLNGYKYKSITANAQRDDVGSVFGFSHLGFVANLESSKLRGMEVVLTLKGSYMPILDTPSIVMTQEAKTYTISLLNQKVAELDFLYDGEKQWLTKALFPNLKEIARHEINQEQQLLSRHKYQQLSVWKPKVDTPINIIVPVYRNLRVTKECLERVIYAKRNYPYKITVVNDCSPEPAIHTYLDELAASGLVHLIKHAVNEGFPTAVNNGMRSDTASDVVLLNSDAYVTDYWLDRLHEAVYKEEKIATGTAFSNNATIFSYPISCQEVEDIPSDLTLEELAQIFYDMNKDYVITVPSGHGFCLYIRRDALKEVGYFDAETWGKGYGEEVDWCQKAVDLGWRHAAATGVFVQHVGSQSFVGDKTELLNNSLKLMSAKYPEYDLVIQEFIALDPFAEVRRNVDLERLRRCGDQFILMINHNLGGGTERHLKDLANILEKEQVNVLILKPDTESQEWLELTSPKFGLDLLARYHADRDFQGLIRDLKSLGVFHVHIHHTIGFTEGFIDKILSDLELSYDVTLHDYTSICPRVTLSQDDGKYCREPSVEVCELCIKQYGAHDSLRERYQTLGSMQEWLFCSRQLLKGARKVFLPSEDARRRMIQHFPKLEFTVRPHPEKASAVTLHSQNENDSTVRVGLIGGISPVKGLSTLYDCAAYAEQTEADIEFIVIGVTADNSMFDNLRNVTIYGSYKPEELKNLIVKSHLDFAAFFSTWPETYCFTLSEALENGLYPFAFDIGAVGDRIRSLEVGCLVHPNTNFAMLVQEMLAFGRQCRKQQKFIELGNDYGSSFVENYYQAASLY